MNWSLNIEDSSVVLTVNDCRHAVNDECWFVAYSIFINKINSFL